MGFYVQNPNPNGFVRFMRKIYGNGLEFKKGYNAFLWFIFAGALFAFCLARLQYLDINGKFKEGAAPGEWYYISRPFYKAGMILHLATVVPAGILVPWQFVPAIRYKVLTFHRINGYLLLLLLVLGNVGGIMIARYSFGGTLATQSFVGFETIITVGSATMAYINIKRLQIDQHRAWMIRTWAYMGVIITTRLIMIISAQIIGHFAGYFFAIPCRQIEFTSGEASMYPACAANMDAYAAIKADFSAPEGAQNVSASMFMSFGMAAWVGIAIHMFGAEVYLRLTPAEEERLRQVSYQRQLERGFKNPGSAGLTVDRFGDAQPWTPPKELLEGKAKPTEGAAGE